MEKDNLTKQKLLTIIVPTYNMEAYLDKCLTSLIVGEPGCELMQRLEVLVINDGSIDSSSAIAHTYEERYPETFKVIDKENGNYGSCINVALQFATGKYIKVLDADDCFETSLFAAYLGHLSAINVDLVINGMDRVDFSNVQKSICKYNIPSHKITDLSALSSEYKRIWMHAVAYRTDLLRQLEYRQTEGISYTDQEWIYLPFAACKNVYYIPGVLYHYFVGREDQTVSSSSYEKHFWMELEGLHVMANYWNRVVESNYAINGVSLNYGYLKARLLTRCSFVYSRILNNHAQQSYIGQLEEFERYIIESIPELYKEIEAINYPDYGQYKFRVHFIRTWHRYGVKMCRFQLWFVNHYMGLVCRKHGK